MTHRQFNVKACIPIGDVGTLWHGFCSYDRMIALSHLSPAVCVPYRHTVSGVAGIAPTHLRLDAPLNPYARAADQKNTRQSNTAARGRYDANSAGPGFAAQVLVEAGLAGADPFAGARGAKAYDSRRAPITTVRLVA